MKKILLVNNREAFIDSEKTILQRTGFELYIATSGEEALSVHKAEKVDLIVTCLDMPGISGDDLCSKIRMDDDLKHVSIIIVCNSSKADMERVARCKANSYITKPIQPEQLLERVAQLLNISERKSYRVLLKVSVNGRSSDGSFFCTSRDISATGMLLQTDRKFAIGECVSCSFFLPGSIRIVSDAEIMRVSKNHDNTALYGARFVNLSPVYKATITDFINSRSKKNESEKHSSFHK